MSWWVYAGVFAVALIGFVRRADDLEGTVFAGNILDLIGLVSRMLVDFLG